MCLKPYFDDFSLNLYKIDRDLKFLCFLPVCSHAHPSCMHMHIHACTHVWGSSPTPPTSTKNLKAQILLEAEIWHIMSLDAKLQIFSSKFEVVVEGGVWHQTPPPPPLNFNLTLSPKSQVCSLGVVGGGGVWHQTPPPPPLNFNLTLSPKSMASDPPHHHP